MSGRINISTFTASIRKFAKWVMVFCMAVYSGFFGLYGVAGASLDSALGKAARFAIGSGIPIVGGVVAESVETVMGTLGAVKSITGVAGITVIIITALSPIIKTASAMWMLRLCAAVLQPVASGNMVSLTSDVADSIGVVFAAMMCVCLLFAGSIGIIIGVGNVV
jgi:stage III sporulation protein AE